MSRVVLVTGCSSGFGREIALAYAKRGDRVIATVRGDTSSSKVHEAFDGSGIDVHQLDVTDPMSVSQLADNVSGSYGPLDLLVNNAGISVVGALEAVSEEDFRDVFETNFFGPVAVTKAFLPAMRQQRGGRIVFISAVGALLNTPYMGVYTASKHAVDSLAAAWDIELRPFGIRVASILPSAFNTAISHNLRVVDGVDAYATPTHRYVEGLLGRIRNGPADLSPIADAVIRAGEDDDPQVRYLVGGGMALALAPLVETMADLHAAQLSATAELWT